MPVKPSGELSITDIVNEFGGTDPDSLAEYYRGAGLVTENNTGVPTSGEMNMSVFYNTALIVYKEVTANTAELVMSDYFTPTEWNSVKAKVLTINAGVTIGSNSVGTPAVRTGVLVGGLALGGSLELEVNGYIYGAGGTGTAGVGGIALQAEIALIVTNNSRIYGGGGSGGLGGTAGTVNTYLDGTGFRVGQEAAWNIDEGDLQVRLISYYYSVPNFLRYLNFYLPAGTTSYTELGFTYERGTYQGNDGVRDNYSCRRKKLNIPGGTGGSGGPGIGAYDVRAGGSAGTQPVGAAIGGSGGYGGNWGASGNTGATGGVAVPPNQEYISAGSAGTAGGLGGYYIVGNSNVTWNVIGDRLGRVS